MSLSSRLFARMLKSPSAETHDIAVEKDIKIPMPDGVNLLADRYYPRQGENRPLILIRTPDGRSGIPGLMNGRVNTIHLQENSLLALLWAMFDPINTMQKAYQHLPLKEADQEVVGKTVGFWQDWLVHDQPGDEWWTDCDFSRPLNLMAA